VATQTIGMHPDELQELERRARKFWVSLIVGFLGLQVLIGIASIVLALSDPTVAVIPNYHQSALDWDVTHRSRQLAEQLGWEIDYNVVPSEQAGQRSLMVTILDRDRQPVSDLNISAKLYRHARGGEVDHFNLKAIAEGNYQADTKLSERGLWQIELMIEGDHGIASISRELEVK
jgi:nitrogen fixation protein FixH